MKQYKFYFLGKDGHIVNGLDVPAADDLAALEAAIPLSRDQAIEIWEATRRVARLTKGGGAAPFDESVARARCVGA
jgi:hypothetical protein